MSDLTFDNFKKSKLRIFNLGIAYEDKKSLKNIGHCRRVYRIGNIVVKMDYCKKIQRSHSSYSYEEAWTQTPAECAFYKKIKKEDLEFFPRTKACKIGNRLVEIQEYIDGEQLCSWEHTEESKMVTDLQVRYKRCDYRPENVVVRNKKPVIVDFGL